MRELLWRLTGWDLVLARHPGASWRQPSTWLVNGERILDFGRCSLRITPPWPRRARAMRVERAQNLAWRIQRPAEAAVAQASEAAPEAKRVRRAHPR